jgi:hypothetical protein
MNYYLNKKITKYRTSYSAIKKAVFSSTFYKPSLYRLG